MLSWLETHLTFEYPSTSRVTDSTFLTLTSTDINVTGVVLVNTMNGDSSVGRGDQEVNGAPGFCRMSKTSCPIAVVDGTIEKSSVEVVLKGCSSHPETNVFKIYNKMRYLYNKNRNVLW